MLLLIKLILPVLMNLVPVTGNSAEIYNEKFIEGVMVDDGFIYDDCNYHAIVHATDGFVYFANSTHHPDTGVHLFRYDPKSGKVESIADITRIFGENPEKVIPQGKIHCSLFEYHGKLYSGTHVGLFEPGGRGDHGPYPGGHFFSYDLKTGKFVDFGNGAQEEGLVAVTFDKNRERLYALTYPHGLFLSCNIETGDIKSYGQSVSGYKWGDESCKNFSIDRSPAVDPRTGNVYWFNANGTVDCFIFEEDRIVELKGHTIERPAMKVTEPKTGNNSVLWRNMRWNDKYNRFFCSSFFSEHLFSYDPADGSIEVIERIAMGPNRKSGTLSRGSLAFHISDDGNTVYYINHCQPYGKLGTSQIGDDLYEGNSQSTVSTIYDMDELHLVTYNLDYRSYIDHGAIILQDGRRPNDCQSLEIGRDGNLYLVGRVPLFEDTTEKRSSIEKIRLDTYGRATPDVMFEVNLIVIPDPLAIRR